MRRVPALFRRKSPRIASIASIAERRRSHSIRSVEGSMEESGECCVDLAQSWLLPLSIHDRNQLEEVSSLLRSFSEKLAQECQVDQGFGVADLDDRSSSIVNSYFPDMNGIDEALCKHGGGFEDIDHASSVDSLSRESRASIVGNFKSIISERLVCLYELFDNSLEVRKLSERRNLLEKTTESLFSDRRPVHLRRRIYSSIPALKPDR